MAISRRAGGRFASLLLSCLTYAAIVGAPPAFSYEVEPMRLEGARPYGLTSDCLLSAYNWCSGWTWMFSDDPGAVWGVVLDPNTCPGGCANGGAVSEVLLYTLCSSVPGAIGGIDVETMDSRNCLVDLLYHSGPMTVTHCLSGDRWTRIPIPLTLVFGNPFALTIEWGPDNNPQLATDNAIANWNCDHGYGFPSCATTGFTCNGWTNLSQATYIYFTDLDDDGTLEDLCALYGAPLGLSFPYLYYYGYLSNNLLMVVGLDCTSPSAVEPTSWGHVKALFD